MARYILGRVVGLIGVLFVVSILAFLLMHSIPGGPFDETKQPLTPAGKANVLRKYGLDRPLPEQYVRYMWAALHGDFGIPFQSPTETVTQLIGRTWPVSIQLGLITVTLAFLAGGAMGLIAATHQNSWIDNVVTFIATLGLTVPNFIIAYWLILILSVQLHWLPTGGWGEPKQLIMPVLAFALGPIALTARYVRASVIETLRADYVRTARAKGLPERAVLLRHSLKNALIPLITILGPQIPNLITGTIFIEVTFRIPGLGKFFVSSIYLRDYPMILAIMLLVACLWGITYLLSDIAYTLADPRIRLAGQNG